MLIIRFSSIGDIVLTTPVVRSIKKQMKDIELHFVIKDVFKETLLHNKYIDKLYTFKKDISEISQQLRNENYDTVIDLHHNLRSLKLKWALSTKTYSFNKLNFAKFLAVNFKKFNGLPHKHIVDRYFETVKPLGIVNDELGLDYFLSPSDEFKIQDKFPNLISLNYIALVIGGSYYTKRIPLNKLIEICQSTTKQFILLGGRSDAGIAKQLMETCSNAINACGELTLNQSAFVLKMSESVVSSDTGLMHIAAAFGKRIFSFWGNTIPEFGMYPYKPDPLSKILEVKNLKCRPCSKLGFRECPRGDFTCMSEINISDLNL